MAFLKKVFAKDAAQAPAQAPSPVPPLATKAGSGPTYEEEPISLLPKECVEHLKVQKINPADAAADFDILLVCLAADFKQRPELYKAIKKLAKERVRARRNSGEVATPKGDPSGVQPDTPKKRLTRTNSAEPIRKSNSRTVPHRSPFDDEDDEDEPAPPPTRSSRRQREIEKMKEEWRRKMRGEMTEEEKMKEEWRRKMRGEMTEEEKLKEEWRKKMRGEIGDASGASTPASNPATPQVPRVATAPAESGAPAHLGAAQPPSAGGSTISANSAGSVTPPAHNASPRPAPALAAGAAASAPHPPANVSPSDRPAEAKDAPAAAAPAAAGAEESAEAKEKREKKERKREKKEKKRAAEAAAANGAPAPAANGTGVVAVPPRSASPRSADAAASAAPATSAPAAPTVSAPATTAPAVTAPSAPAAGAPQAQPTLAPAPVSRDKSPFTRSKDRITKPPVEHMLELAKSEDPAKYYGDRTRIGKGGFGDVYLASDLRLKKGSRQSQVAIKVSREKISNTFHAELIANEIVLLSQCRHKNIVNYLEHYLFRERIWMVMEYCDGGTLTQLYKGVELNELHHSFIIKSILLGLQYLHDQNRLHRDIKGENILLNMDGEIKIADLGLAAEAEEKGSGLVGSRYWMSPEMIRREGYDFKTDIWSMGCVLIEMCNLEPPYHEYRSMKALFKIATKGAAPLKTPDVWSAPLKSFLAAATQFDPEERPDAAELLKHPWLVKSGKKEDMMKATEVVFLGNSLRMNGF